MLAIASIGTVGFIRRAHGSLGSGSSASGGAALAGNDAEVIQQIKDEHGTEARQWLSADAARSIGGLSSGQATRRVDELYQLGAKQVLAFGSRISSTLAVELPDDKAKRKALFDWQARWHAEHHFDVEQDIGQRWLVIKMPLF